MDSLLPLLWVLPALPPLMFVFLLISYFMNLRQKRLEIERLLNGEILELYTRTYGLDSPKEIFFRFHNRTTFILPVLLNVLTTMVVAYGYLIKQVAAPDVNAVTLLLSRIPDAAFVGFLGAFLWSQLDAIRRYSSVDLSPSFLYLVWVRFMVGGAIGTLAASALVHPIDLLAAFGIGALPIDQLRDWARARAARSLDVNDRMPVEAPTLHHLDGATAGLLERLAEEQIASVQHLAMANPVKLLLRTNVDWLMLLDLIDQALLRLYAAAYADKLRAYCVRGAIELAEIYGLTISTDPVEVQCGARRLQHLADHLGCPMDSIDRLTTTIGCDPQVEFVWRLWTEAAGDRGGTSLAVLRKR